MSSKVAILGRKDGAYASVLTPEAVAFVAELARTFAPRVETLLGARKVRHAELLTRATKGNDALDFLPETRAIRDGDWVCAKLPPDLLDRRVEITGPVDRKMIINALNSGASVFMADFEDANSPSWQNCIEGQINLRDANLRTITYASPEGKTYKLGDTLATLFVMTKPARYRSLNLRRASMPLTKQRSRTNAIHHHRAR